MNANLAGRPFGAPAEDVFKSEVAVLIGAGIGVTVRLSFTCHGFSIGSRRRLIHILMADVAIPDVEYVAIREYPQTYLGCPTSREARCTTPSRIHLVLSREATSKTRLGVYYCGVSLLLDFPVRIGQYHLRRMWFYMVYVDWTSALLAAQRLGQSDQDRGDEMQVGYGRRQIRKRALLGIISAAYGVAFNRKERVGVPRH